MFQFLFFALVGLASLVAASDPTTPQRLRAKSNSTSLAYNGFYFATYHQGAGFDDATLISNASQALGGAFLNATSNPNSFEQYYLDFNTSIPAGNESLFYHAQLQGFGGYSSLQMLTVNLAQAPEDGFSFDAEGRLAWQNVTSWAACEFIHTVPDFVLQIANRSLDILVFSGSTQSTLVLPHCLADVPRLNWSGKINSPSSPKVDKICFA